MQVYGFRTNVAKALVQILHGSLEATVSRAAVFPLNYEHDAKTLLPLPTSLFFFFFFNTILETIVSPRSIYRITYRKDIYTIFSYRGNFYIQDIDSFVDKRSCVSLASKMFLFFSLSPPCENFL